MMDLICKLVDTMQQYSDVTKKMKQIKRSKKDIFQFY